MSILGIDIGTTRCTAAVYARDGQLLRLVSDRYPLLRPSPWAIELNAEQVLSVVTGTMQAVVQGLTDRVRVLSYSTQGETVVPVNAAGYPLGPALTTFDQRPVSEYHRFVEQIGHDRLHQITGLSPQPMYALAKILWWKKWRPDIADHAARFLDMGALFLQRLGLEPVTDYSLGGRTLAMDVRIRQWSAEILDMAGLSVDLFPRLLQAGTFLGLISPRIAREVGLPRGVQVILGGHDQACSALGCGATEPGMAMDATGAVECLAPVLTAPVVNQQMFDQGYGCYPHVVPDRYLALAYHFSAGSLLHWYRVTFGHVEEEEAYRSGQGFYEILVKRAGGAPSPVLILPYFTLPGMPAAGQHCSGAVLGLSLTTSKEQILKGLLEGLAFAIRRHVDALHEAGVIIERVRAVGGGATAQGWLQLKASIFRRAVEGVAHHEAPVRGAMMLAGLGAGFYRNLQDALSTCVLSGPACYPDDSVVMAYESQYRRFQRMSPAIFTAWRDSNAEPGQNSYGDEWASS